MLIIEDDEHIRNILRDILESCSSEIVILYDGTIDAVLTMSGFDIIFTDYRLPVMDGLKVTKLLRERFPQAMIIGMSSDDVEREFIANGADAFIKKPFSIKDILRFVQIITP